ncbi:b(0,+)-type amino acid transporter 1-like [Anneissia japonica]|uniref:b(0,+)-type amino acid transporter 1-like n=1 Tax=Anneissia japonica TaxID=1529436 RepID=UPI00142576A8|nr:b(0,+)-type amino acid transporter 1-like [Anneissia japonica]
MGKGQGSKDDPDGAMVLKRQVGLVGGIALLVGTIIGSGIFISPKGVLRSTESLGMSLVIWMVCGVLAMLASLCYAELGTIIPKSGGEYAYLGEAFGPIPAYLFSWTYAIVLKPSSLAAITLTFGTYFSQLFVSGSCSAPTYLIKMWAVLAILLIAFINSYSVKWATRVQVVFTAAKVLALVIIIFVGFIRICQGYTEHLDPSISFEGSSTRIFAYGIAFYQGLWAYDSWNQLNFVTEELVNPKRYGCPKGWVQSSNLFVSDKKFSTYRLAFVSAREGHMMEILSMVHIKRFTPFPSIVFTSFIAILMLLPNDFDTLVNYFSFAAWLFYGATFTALLVLRYKYPNIERPIKVPIVIPIFVLLASVYLVIAPIIDKPELDFLYAVIFILAGLLLYYPFVHKKLSFKCNKTFTYFLQKLMRVVPSAKPIS